ncbi:hypothetical protein MMC13_001198 [Lambiella insularis]|nr:hypothetical protein [Lambiella insularis]
MSQENQHILSQTTSPREVDVLPTFVLVPGAWHSPAHFEGVMYELNLAGHETRCLRLPGVNSLDPKTTSTTTDADFIRDRLLLPLLEEGKEIVLVVHSYGGMPGGAAACGLSKQERSAAGLPGGIVGLIYIAALIAREGDALVDMMGGQLHEWNILDKSSGQISPANPKEVFYADVPRPVAKHAVSELGLQAEGTLFSPTGPQAWKKKYYKGRRAYIHALQDQAIPPDAQSGMIAGSGVEWNVIPYNTSHSPFLSKPERLSQTFIELAEGWD